LALLRFRGCHALVRRLLTHRLLPAIIRAMSLRIIDANLNRAREGLRTAEEYARLTLNDAKAARALKEVRRGLEACAAAFGPELLAARLVQTDVGISPQAVEVRRGTETDVASAAFKRAQEALRVIEEFAQLHNPAAAKAAAQARYAAYSAEQQVLVCAPRRAVLRESPVMAILPARPDWRDQADSLLHAGCRLFQLRDKLATTLEFVHFAQAFVEIAARSGALTIINDRPDIASAIGADGVHIGQTDLPMPETRRIMGPVGIVGVSTHNLAEAQAAEQSGADYVGLGAMFHTETKKVQSIAGPRLVSQVQLDIPVFCIGGINRTNVAELAGHGARHIAVSSALFNTPDAGAEYSALVQALGERA
jgi:thiamine-phosphate pyrophosphorylase